MGQADDARVDARHGIEELLGTGQVALGGHEGEHELIGAPAGTEHGVAQEPGVSVFVVSGNLVLLGYARDLVEDASCLGRLDRAGGHVDDLVRSALEEATAYGAVRAGRERRCRLVAECARSWVLAAIAEGDAHAADGRDLDIGLFADVGKEFCHSRLLAHELLFIGEIEPFATPAFVHDGARGRGVAVPCGRFA